MSLLTASNLAKSFGPQDIFAHISLEVPHGAKIALVGANGTGKTTLLRLLAGLETPTDGTVHRAKDLRVSYLPQQADFAGDGTLWEALLVVFADLQAQATEMRRLEAAMADPAVDEEILQRYGAAMDVFERAGGYTYEQRIEHVLSGLGFDPDDFSRPVTQLSGGQKTRALLARLLLEEPGLLLLDEPTNHLDLAGIEWLERYLQAWKGAVIVVAHDRAFLDSVVDRVWEMAWGQLTHYRGNYSAYVIQKAEREAEQQVAYQRQKRSIARTEDYIRRNISGQRTRQAQGRRKRLERLERIERPRAERSLKLDLGDVARSGDLVLGLYDLAAGYAPGSSLVEADEFELRRGERMALLGPNGSGKTTLVRTILGELPPLDGRVRIGASVQIGYFAQGHADLDPEKTILETIQAAGELKTGEARSLLGRYRFSGDDVFKRVGDLSGGEQARVALAVLTLQGANVLVLDEPTNHLDIPSQQVLQEALAEFGGTMLMVTHDRYLIHGLATGVWAIEDGRLWAFDEGYPAYQAWLVERRDEVSEASLAKAAYERAREQRRAEQRKEARRDRRRSELEHAIHRLEARQEELAAALAAASADQAVQEVSRLGAEYGQVQAELEGLLADWEEVAA